MTTIGATTTVLPPGRTVRIAGRDYPLILPSLRDPRLHLASVIITLQVLGQTSFHFDLSIAQILVALLTSAGLEVVITFMTRRVVAWPASAMLTGNGVAFVLRVPGTQHGDWWSLHGAWIFAATAAVSLLSKYAIRRNGRHVFNPSNLGLLVCFLALGSNRADPLDLWWARMSPALAFALAVIVCGGLVITRRTGMIGAAVGFWVTFAALVGILAASGHCMTARWHIGPICGGSFWFLLVTSPEILVFLFFMITDPRTAPASPRARIAFGVLVAFVATFLIAPQRTEFGTKVALLGSLAILCALRPLVERLVTTRPRAHRRGGARAATVLALTTLSVAVITSALVLAGTHARHAPALVAVSRGAGGRSAIHVDPRSVPPVTIAGDVHSIDASMTRDEAHRLVTDVVADLATETDALTRRDPKLAAAVDVGPRYLNLAHAIDTTPRAAVVVVDEYRLRRARVVLARTSFQAGPQIAVDVTGTMQRVRYRGAVRLGATGPPQPITKTFVLLHSEGWYFIATDQPT